MAESLPRNVAIKPYTAQVYDRLNLFRSAKLLLKKHQHQLVELGDVIVHHNLHERYGIALLHKHFDLMGGEMLVRRIDRHRRRAEIRPVSLKRAAAPYLWRAQFAPAGEVQVFPLEFLEQAEAP